jgi:DNA-binding HxlR family transcriptional regulator
MTTQRHQDLRKEEDLYAQDVSHAIELLRAKWTIPIVCAMRERPVRLSELRRLLPAASKKALVASLRILEAKDLVLRKELSNRTLHV